MEVCRIDIHYKVEVTSFCLNLKRRVLVAGNCGCPCGVFVRYVELDIRGIGKAENTDREVREWQQKQKNTY